MSDLPNNSESKKTEILEKSRKSKLDEGMEYADLRGTKTGIVIYAIVAAVIIGFSIPDHIIVVNAIASLSFAWVVGGTLSYYRFTKKKAYLLCIIASIAATIAFTLMVVLEAIR